MAAASSPSSTSSNPARQTWMVFGISVLGLFLELMLIRWIGTEIRIFAYLQNTVLVVCFLGLGMGCWTCREPVTLRQMLIPMNVLVLLLTVPFTRDGLRKISVLLSPLPDFLVWDYTLVESPMQVAWMILLGAVLTLALMILLWYIFVPIGRLLGRAMDEHPRPIWAYSVNVAGSLVGIWLFVGLSAWYSPPWVWCLVLAGLSLPWLGLRQSLEMGLLAAMVVVSFIGARVNDEGELIGQTATSAATIEVHWTPYQKLGLVKKKFIQPTENYTWYEVNVNNTSYQSILDLRPEVIDKRPLFFDPKQRGLSQYDVALLVKPQPRNMLVVGAGTGNDVAGGLRHGAEHIVAVEIDPVIIDLGRRFHPEKPYDFNKVEIVNDDARSYFANSRERFDLIIFGLLDAHTTTAMANARLDHYVYTRESIQQAKSLLAEGGVMVLSFAVQKPFVADRMAGVLRDVFQKEPLSFLIPTSRYGAGAAVFVTGNLNAAHSNINATPGLADQIAAWQNSHPLQLPGTTPVTTDDWPYLYLERPCIPILYIVLAVLLAALLYICLGRLRRPDLLRGWKREEWHFFFLGAAFLLLEVQNISKAAVALGNTWLVNAVIISGILVMVLLANAVVSRFPRIPPQPVFAGLIACCLVLYFIDLAWFAGLPYAGRALVVGGLTSLPMLFSGIIFVRSFAAAPRKDIALGGNLLGGLVGGLLQTITFITGMKALLLIVAGLYVAALLMRPRAVTTDVKSKLATVPG